MCIWDVRVPTGRDQSRSCTRGSNLRWKPGHWVIAVAGTEKARVLWGMITMTAGTVKPRFSRVSVFKQLSYWPSCSWKKCLCCLAKLWVWIFYTTTLSCWYWCGQSCVSQATKEISFSNKSLLSFLEWIKFKNRGSTTDENCVPGSVLSTWHMLSHVILTAQPWRDCCYLHFADEQPEAWGDLVALFMSHRHNRIKSTLNHYSKLLTILNFQLCYDNEIMLDWIPFYKPHSLFASLKAKRGWVISYFLLENGQEAGFALKTVEE